MKIRHGDLKEVKICSNIASKSLGMAILNTFGERCCKKCESCNMTNQS